MKLKQHSLLAYIHPTNLEQLERVSQEITLKKGETLFRQEDIAHSIYFVREGTLKILKTSSMGQEKIFSLYQGGQFVALSTLFNPPHRYPATAMAVEETIVVKVPREALEAGILSTEVATREWFKQLNRRLEGVQQLLTDQVFIDAKERFRKWLQRFTTAHMSSSDDVFVKIPVTKQEIADLLSIRRETFSRLLGELKEGGLCEVKGKTFKINRQWLSGEE